MITKEERVVYGTEDLLTTLCSSVTRVLNVASQSRITRVARGPYLTPPEPDQCGSDRRVERGHRE